MISNKNKKFNLRQLGSGLFKDIMLEILKRRSEKIFTTDDMIKEVEEYYLENGGTKINRDLKDIFSDARKALNKIEGYRIENIEKGVWEFYDEVASIENSEEINYDNVIFKSIDILNKSLSSEDEQIRVNSAIALLNYFK